MANINDLFHKTRKALDVYGQIPASVKDQIASSLANTVTTTRISVKDFVSKYMLNTLGQYGIRGADTVQLSQELDRYIAMPEGSVKTITVDGDYGSKVTADKLTSVGATTGQMKMIMRDRPDLFPPGQSFDNYMAVFRDYYPHVYNNFQNNLRAESLSGSQFEEVKNSIINSPTVEQQVIEKNDAKTSSENKILTEERRNALTIAENSLKKFGLTLTDEEKRQILSADKDNANVIASSIVNAKAEEAISGQLSQVVPQELLAIKDWETEAVEGSKREVEEATPYLYQSLNSRGLLDTGSLSTALAKEYGIRVMGVKSKANEMSLNSKLGGITKSYENALRGALASGASLSDAIKQANEWNTLNRTQTFTAEQSNLDRQAGLDAQERQIKWLLANMPKQSSPSGWDYFYQYGLPVLGGLTGVAVKAGLNTLFSKNSNTNNKTEAVYSE